MRAYVPISISDLATIAAAGQSPWRLPAGKVHTVTAQLGAEFPDADAEELEWVAFTNATDDALPLASTRGAVPLRAVLSVDVPPDAITPAIGGPASAAMMTATDAAVVAALHVDGRASALIAAGRGGGAGPTGAQARALGDAHLLWYHPSEIAQVVADALAAQPLPGDLS